MKTINLVALLMVAIFSLREESFAKEESDKLSGIVGSVLSINADFDIYKVDMVGYK